MMETALVAYRNGHLGCVYNLGTVKRCCVLWSGLEMQILKLYRRSFIEIFFLHICS
jgi:hypothetical protein